MLLVYMFYVIKLLKMLLDKLETKTEVYSDMTAEELMKEKLRLLEILENYKK